MTLENSQLKLLCVLSHLVPLLNHNSFLHLATPLVFVADDIILLMDQ